MNAHLDKHYEEELRLLKDQILKMGGIVEEMINQAMKSLTAANISQAQALLTRDREVNQLEIEIDELCLRLLALRQPAASDLRFITIGLRISKDLERMGDLAVNIAERVIALNKESSALRPSETILNMGVKVQQMVKSVLDAFVKRDVERAEKICEEDEEVDRFNWEVHRTVIEIMKSDGNTVQQALQMLLVSRNLERIADHATNIAEEIVFMVKGKDIRHKGKLESAS